MSSPKRIIILGGSYGGVSTAHYLLKHAVPQLPVSDPHQVVLVSASSQAMCRPACPRAMISDDLLPQDKLFVDIQKQFEQYTSDHFRFVCGTAAELDHINRSVSIRLADGNVDKMNYHALVIATGASTPSPLLSLNRDEKFLHATGNEFRKALLTAKRIVIAGGGPAGVETAGELGEYLNGRAGFLHSKLANPKVSITLVTSGSKILPVLRPSLAEKAEGLLNKVGVTVLKNSPVKTVTPDGAGTENVASGATVTLDNGEVIEADLYIPATGQRPNTNFVNPDLLESTGRVDTNPSTLRVDKARPRVYAIGDVASYARPAVHLILDAIPVLCGNLKRDLLLAAGTLKNSVKEERTFKEDKRETQMVPVGKSKGVGAAMGLQLPSFMVWLIKGRDYWLWTTGPLWSGKQWAKES